MKDLKKHHFHLVSGNVTGHFKFERDGKIVDDISTFPVQSIITTVSAVDKPLKVVAQAQTALKKQYTARLPEGQDVLHTIVDCQVHTFNYLGHMTNEEFFEGLEDQQIPSENAKELHQSKH